MFATTGLMGMALEERRSKRRIESYLLFAVCQTLLEYLNVGRTASNFCSEMALPD